VRPARAVALVPAYNEEAIIGQTIASLMAQTYRFEYVLVIANNCTDQTVPIVRKLQEQYGRDRLRLLVMENNIGLKAGALNYGFSRLDLDLDFVFSMDADTIVDSRMLEEGIKKFAREPKTGGICSAYRTLPLKANATRWERFLWRIQNIEFGLANAWRIENHRSARVLPGVSTLYRMETLKAVAASHEDEQVWVVGNMVEDYILTLEIKDQGWDAKSSQDMISWSDVPLSLTQLRRQRERWYSGTIDVVRPRILKQHSRYEVVTITLLLWNLLMRALLIGAYGALIIHGIPIQWLSPFLVLPIAAAATQLYRLKYADQLDKWQYFFTATLVVNELYAVYRELLYVRGFWLSYRRPGRSW
jgi:cellulose synthase/poly-beta-1,6-N-acetylglucosamine synthase-like glycosyltransferase